MFYSFNGKNLELFNKKENFIFVNEIVDSKTVKELSVPNYESSKFILQCTVGFTVGFVALYKDLPSPKILFLFSGAITLGNMIYKLNSMTWKRKNPFEKYILEGTDVKIPNECYEEDSNGRKIKVCNGNVKDEWNYYVCDEKLVVPRYLIQCNSKCQWQQ